MVEPTQRTLEWRESLAAVAGAGFIALALAMGIGRFAFTPILPMMMREDAALSVAAGGWLAAANYIGYLLGALSAVTPRMRMVTAIRAALIVTGLTTAGMGLTDYFVVWILLRALAGFASAWVLIFVSAWCLEKLVRVRRPLLNGIVYAGVGAGIAVSGGLCLALMQAHASADQAWIALGMLALVLSFAVWPVLGKDGPAAQPVTHRCDLRGTLRRDGIYTRLILCYGACGFGYIIPATFLPAMARTIVHDPVAFGWCWPIFGAAALASTLAAAALSGVISNRRLWIMSHLGMAFGAALPVFRPGIAAVLLSALIVGGTFMVATMAGMREAREVAGEHAAGLMAAMTAAFAAGQVAGPLCVSYVASNDGNFSGALLLASALLVFSAGALGTAPTPVSDRNRQRGESR